MAAQTEDLMNASDLPTAALPPDSPSSDNGQALQLAWALERLAQLQGTRLDALALDAALQPIRQGAHLSPAEMLRRVADGMGWGLVRRLPQLDPVALPWVGHDPALGWWVAIDRLPHGDWLVEHGQGRTALAQQAVLASSFWLNLQPRAAAAGHKRFADSLRQALRAQRPVLVEAVLATVFISMLALATSLFSMQVYDRVIPTRSEHTLLILALGVVFSVLIELAMKLARARAMDAVVIGIDARLSRQVFERLLGVRVDQLPASVGSLAAQLRGYEQVRSFYTASTLFTLVDLPMGLVFVFIIAWIGSPAVAMVPVAFAVLAVLAGWVTRRRVLRLATEGARASNLKTGLLVEAVEGVETIKAGAGGWKFLARWIDVNATSIRQDSALRKTAENSGYLSGALQQLSYAGLVAVGAWVVMQGHMSMGALIACSILGGRVLAPVMAIPGLLVQHAHASAAADGLEKLYALPMDNEGIDRPLAPSRIEGGYQLTDVVFAYPNSPTALRVQQWQVAPGERVGVVGPVGSGKSTLLRMLTGLYQPQQGRVLLDGLDIGHISRQVFSREVGYLQQDHRLFAGSLRENLLVGLPDPGDQALHDALKRSGLIRLVASHPRGLELPIFEGGKGLSGGQRQLVAFTRLLLAQPTICLLDEPTASMDEEQERRCLGVLTELLTPQTTLVVVTHKPSVLPLVQRLVVVAGGSIVLDGPRDEVLARLQRNALAGATAAATSQAARAEPLPAENRAENPADTGRGQRLEPTTS